ncbi:MAG: dihydroneopterin aldolase [Candidatus Latescibacterota bacterium]
MGTDILRLRNMRFYAHHGVFAEEGVLGQQYEVDVEVRGDFSRAGHSDRLEHTVDYPRLCALVEEVVTGRRFALVEALAEHIALRLGREFAPVDLTVRVRKPHPPVNLHFDGIEVEIHRVYG